MRPVRLESLSLTTVSGQALNIDSLFADKHTILNFWATWCKPCITEMPMLDSLSQSLDKDKWQLFLISDESVEKINAFKAKTSYSMPFLKLAGKNSDLGISALPKTLVIDETMKVLWSKTGGLTSTTGEMREKLLGLE
jgi:thiol-disulfide isomerase/thioredoxin